MILRVTGALLLLIGIASALLGPLEMYCFSLFSKGGRFHYEGFGFGSFMFGNIACQIVGYYLIAAVLIPLGYGHLKVRRWAGRLSLAVLGFWMVAGVPLVVAFLFVLLSSKDPTVAGALLALVLAGLSYTAIPALLARFYRSRDVQATFAAWDSGTCWLEGLPVPVLVLALLCLFHAVCLHSLIYFGGLFPLFGALVSGLPGIALIDGAMAVLVLLTWGILRQRGWAWWGALVFFLLLALSTVVTLAQMSLPSILSHVRLAPLELEALSGMPLHGWHLAVLAGIPLLLTLVLLARSRRCFGVRVSSSDQ